MINLTQNIDLYRFYPDISDDEGLGRLYADELGTIDIPEHLSLIHISRGFATVCSITNPCRIKGGKLCCQRNWLP